MSFSHGFVYEIMRVRAGEHHYTIANVEGQGKGACSIVNYLTVNNMIFPVQVDLSEGSWWQLRFMQILYIG
jgi:hypothetical protein